MSVVQISNIIVLMTLLPLFSCKGEDKRYEADEVKYKSQVGILKMRGFRAEVHYAITRDGHHLNLIRIINPFFPVGGQRKRPVLFNHGLLESSTIWLINSRNVHPMAKEEICWSLPIKDNTAKDNLEFRNPAMMLAINGYDVWLLSMRGTDWSLYHEIMDRSQPEFWDYSLDQFAQDDLPSAVEYIRRTTGAHKVAYVGHSQATFAIFGLLASRPHFADIIEPIFAVAPVSYFSNVTSVSRMAFLASLDGPQTNGPLPESAKQVRQTLTKACVGSDKKGGPLQSACSFMEDMIAGSGQKPPAAFFSHIPYFTSLKVFRHFGQLIQSSKFTMYDHGKDENLKRYGQPEAPLYHIDRIKSRSLVLIWSKTDTISHPKDVERFISELKVPLHRNIFIDGTFNHFDLLMHKDSDFLVNKPILEVLEDFERRKGVCSSLEPQASNLNSFRFPFLLK